LGIGGKPAGMGEEVVVGLGVEEVNGWGFDGFY